MALNIKRSRVDELARRSAQLREVSITDAVEAALERDVIALEAQRARRMNDLMKTVREIQARIAAAPVLDARSAAEIMDEMDEDILARHR